jgi:lysophospholipase L1-like esterase
MKILFSNIKKSIARILTFFDLYINYPGLRFETQIIRKKFEWNTSGIVIVCIGDSNTFGWNNSYRSSYPVLLEEKLKSEGIKVRVINCGIGGDTISDCTRRLEKDVLFFKPGAVIINFGFNDAMLLKIKRNNKNKKKSNLLYLLNDDYYKIRTDLKKFRHLFEKIVKELQENHIKVILTGLYEVKKIKTGMFYKEKKELAELQNKIFREYDNCIKDIALKNNTVFFDLWNNLNNYEKIENCLQDDGFHLDYEGYKLIAGYLSGVIVKNCFLK